MEVMPMSDTPLYQTPIGDQAPRALTATEVAECLRVAAHIENWYIGVREVLQDVEAGNETNLQQIRWIIDGYPALHTHVQTVKVLHDSYHAS